MSSHSDTVTDARGRSFAPRARPLRVVSLVPSITELLFALGLDTNEIVGRTKFCVHPAQLVPEVTVVGGTKTVHLEQVRVLEPDLVIADVDENMREAIEEIDAWEGGPDVFVTHPRTVDDALLMIRDLGVLLSAGDRSEPLLADIAAARAAVTRPMHQSALYLIWRQPYMTVSPDTYIHSMLHEAGYRHVIDEDWLDLRYSGDESGRRYPEISVEDIAELQPAHILLSSEPFPFKEEHIDELRQLLRTAAPDWAETVSIRIVDGELYSWYGSRMLVAFREWAAEG